MKGELASWRFVDHAAQLLIIVSYETISDLMTLQDQIDAFQKLIFSHFRGGTNNECRIAALVPLVQESYGIYKFITSMLRAMHTSMLVQLAVLSLR
jgi:huntingtin-interacting protein 1-related protein